MHNGHHYALNENMQVSLLGDEKEGAEPRWVHGEDNSCSYWQEQAMQALQRALFSAGKTHRDVDGHVFWQREWFHRQGWVTVISFRNHSGWRIL